MIGLDTPGFNVEWLAIVTAIILGLLKDKFKECSTVRATRQLSGISCTVVLTGRLL